MKRVDTIGRLVDKHGPGKDGYQASTIVGPDAMDGPQEEILTPVETAGLTPDGADLGQLLKANDILYGRLRPFEILNPRVDYRAITIPGALAAQFSDDGSNLYVMTEPEITQYPLSEPFVLTSIGAAVDTFSLALITDPRDFVFADGNSLRVLSDNPNYVWFTSQGGSAWDLSTVAALQTSLRTSIATSLTLLGGLGFSADGTDLYILGYQSPNVEVRHFSLSGAYNVSSPSLQGTLSVDGFNTSALGGVAVDSTGRRLVVSDRSELAEFYLGTVNAANTGTEYRGRRSFSELVGDATDARGPLHITPDGKHAVICNQTTGAVCALRTQA